MKLDIEYLVANMTIEEKAGLCSGEGMWWTKSVERLGLPRIMVSDGPNGLRKESTGVENIDGPKGTVMAIGYPTGSAIASSFDRALLKREGELLGEEAHAEGLQTLLGPAVNMKRSPLCGRNFEYFTEDPYLAGELAVAYTEGVQSKGVGVSVKHFAANNQECCRMSTDEIVSERALREIYLPAFEIAVKKAKPWTIMCSYNRINGSYSSENKWLLEDVLRGEWGFDGIVMTDWGAVNDRVKGLKNGLELEMPGSFGVKDVEIVDAIRNGSLTVAELDKAVRRLLVWIDRGLQHTEETAPCDKEQHHQAVAELEKECAVLLKNDKKALPLKKNTKVTFIGTFAKNVRYQGGGSSHVTVYRVPTIVEEAAKFAEVSYCPGWNDDGETMSKYRLSKALKAAEASDKVVIFAGLPDSFESEGYDRSHMDLPQCQNELIRKVAARNRNVVVVLFTGSPVRMPWISSVNAVLEMYLGGEGVAEACASLLFGDANPSGHLAETFPMRLEDNPSYMNFPGNGKSVFYGEDIYIGYRWYDSRKMKVLFPFGHGLSYTTFDVPETRIVSVEGTDVTVEAIVRNTGAVKGKCVLQLYVNPFWKKTARPTKELKGFEKVELEPGESKTVTFMLDKRSFSYYEGRIQDWYYESGEYGIELGFSSRDIRAKLSVNLKSEPLPLAIDDSLTVNDLVEYDKIHVLGELSEDLFRRFGVGEDSGEETALTQEAALSVAGEMPVKSFPSFTKVPPYFKESIYEKLKEEE